MEIKHDDQVQRVYVENLHTATRTLCHLRRLDDDEAQGPLIVRMRMTKKQQQLSECCHTCITTTSTSWPRVAGNRTDSS